MNPSKLKVVELRAELASRGLDTKGNKAVLVERLQEALDTESGGVPTEKSLDETQDEGNNASENNESDINETVTDTTLSQLEESEELPEESNTHSEVDTEEQISEKEKEPEESSEEVENNQSITGEPTPIETSEEPQLDTDSNTQEKEETLNTSCALKENPSEYQDSEQNKENEDYPMAETNGTPIKKESFEECPDIKMEHDGDVKIKTEPVEVKEERDRDTERQERKRKRSPSPHRKDWNSVKAASRDEEPELNENDVVLSWYDSDLNLLVEKDTLLKAAPLSDAGFGYIWAGVRGTFGYTSGHLVYQVKLTEFCDVSQLEDEPNPNVLRVGWSALGTSMQLGEEPLSYGYGGTGKVSVNCKFRDYGKSFGLNDVVTAYLDFNEDAIVMSYAVNDHFCGEAFTLNESELKGRALAPHFLSKNVKFEVNFGQIEPWYPIRNDYTFLNQVPSDQCTAGPRRPDKKSDCEMIMMCGLPGCGKTYWAKQHCAANPDKLFNVLGTNALIDKMKVMGLPRKANYHGRWDLLIEKCTKCLQRLMDIGSRRRRNYILDQTNVYPAAQRRKMRNFEGFTRKAVVIVPTDEEFKRRVNEREQLEGKDVPDSAVMEMKANFTLPDKSIFSEVMYTELDESESRKLVRKYNDEAVSAGFQKKGPQGGPPPKRFRGGDFQHGQQQGGSGRHDSFRGRSNAPGGGHQFRRGGGGGNRGGGGGWQQRQGGGDRWRDNRGGGGMMRNHGGGGGGYSRQQGGGGDRQQQQGGWRGGSSGGGRGPRDNYGGGGDRNRGGGGYDRNQGGGNRQQGGGRGGGSGGSYNRDNRKDSRQNQKRGGSSGASGGSIAAAGGSQWGGQYQSSGGGQQGGSQTWGGQQQQAWQQPQQQQQWGNYQQPQQQQQQPWKGGYNQGGSYQQQGQAAGYGQQGASQGGGYGQQYAGSTNNWQQYGGYGGYGQPNWGQNWQQWYGQGSGSGNQASNTAIQPPPAK